MPPAARISDMHTCPMVNPGPVPHVGGPVSAGSGDVLVGFMPAARVGDSAICVPGPDTIAMGASDVLINNKMAARLGDSTAHGGKIVVGCPTVLIGTSPQSFALTGAAASGAPFCEECEKARQELAKQQAAEASSPAAASTTAAAPPAPAEAPSSQDKTLDELYRKAGAAKNEIDAAADDIAAQHGGTVAKAPLKSRARVLEKANNDYDGDVSRVKDFARNTIVVKSGHELKALESLRAKYPDLPAKSVKIVDASKDPCGYSGINVSVPTKSGMPGEMQINSPEMIYAKEKPADARRILGDAKYEATQKKLGGIEGGKGHTLYEKFRSTSDPTEKAKAAAESRAYYDSVRAASAKG
jgi:uncharacterized Zn-binding protein involved in type VI secretion